MNKATEKAEIWLTIVNPAGANGRVGRAWPVLQKRLETAGVLLEVRTTAFPLHAVELVAEGVREGFRRILAVGGDGTNNEVINGVMQQEVVPPNELLYALLPVGTGNDWIRTHHIPGAFDEWVRMIKAGHNRFQDIGLVTYRGPSGEQQRFFANIAGLAYDAYVVSVTERRRNLIVGRFIYLLLVLLCLFRYRLKEATVNIDGTERSDRFYTINIGICRYSGGGMQFVPHAIPDDGQLAYTTAGPLSKWEVLRATPYFYNGKVAEYKRVITGTASHITVSHPKDEDPTPVEVDGEFLGYTPAVFSIRPGALRIVVPANA